jgi:hypothetical protein
MSNFSFNEYTAIVNRIQYSIPIKSFDSVYKHSNSSYCVIRHDVEFSIERALELAYIEKSLDISSTYVFQICNNNYNPFSHKNRDLIHEIYNLGHDIGVHVHLGNFDDKEMSIQNYIIKQSQLLSIALDLPINKFSIHRPRQEHIQDVVRIPGLINMNDTMFFTYTNSFSVYDLPVLYLADSNHAWKYGHPLEIDFNRISKMQLNCHPFSWTEKGLDNRENFYILTKEKQLEALQSINEEIKTYPKDLYETERNILGRS